MLKKIPFVFSVSNVGFCARADLLHIFTLVGISGADSSTANLIAFFGSTTFNHKVFNHKKDNIFSTTLHNHISERNLKWRNLCGKLRRALALSLILQIYSLTKLDNKIVFFFLASLSQFRSHYLSDLRQKFRKWKFQIKTRIGKVRHCPLSTVTEQQNIFFKNHDNQHHRHLMIIVIKIVNIFTPVTSQQNIFFKMPMKASLKSLLVIA